MLAVNLPKATSLLLSSKEEHLHMFFIDLEKAYDMITKDLIRWILNKMSAPWGYMDIVKDI